MSKGIEMATKILKYAPRVTWLCGWSKLPDKYHWQVSYQGVVFGEVFCLKKGRKFYGLIYDRDFTEFPSGCIESTNFTEICDAVAGIGVNKCS